MIPWKLLGKARTPGEGVLTIWSSGPDGAFLSRLRQAEFDAPEVRERGRGKIKKNAHHFIWVATRP